jgi:hypothetical protein
MTSPTLTISLATLLAGTLAGAAGARGAIEVDAVSSAGAAVEAHPGSPPAGTGADGRTDQTGGARGHSWLADRVLLLYDRAGLAEGEHATALLARPGGLEALIACAHEAGDATHARYYIVAIEDADSARIVRLFRSGLPEANAHRASVLLAVGAWLRRQPAAPAEVFAAQLAAARGLDGGARRRVLADLLAVPALNGAQLAAAIRATEGSVNRSSARADLLITAAEGRTLDAVARAAYLQAAASIPARGHRERALRAVRTPPPRQSIGFSLATMLARRDSRNGGSTTFSPSVAASSSTAKPGPSVAISNSTPFGSRT